MPQAPASPRRWARRRARGPPPGLLGPGDFAPPAAPFPAPSWQRWNRALPGVRPQFTIRTNFPAGTGTCDEVLLQLRGAGGEARSSGRQPAALGGRPVRRDPLREPAAGGRQPARVGRPAAAVPPRDRAALRLLDAARRVHGERRDDRRGGAARDARGIGRARRARRALPPDLGAARETGAP